MRPVLPLLLFAAACGGASPSSTADSTTARDSLTRRQKDSITAQSELPGARGVGKALEAQDTAAARNRALDSIANAP
jgi:hypothetical protein